MRVYARAGAAIAIGLFGAVLAARAPASATAAVPLPAPVAQAGHLTRVAAPKGDQTAVFAGGCFWGVQAVFQHLKGVKTVVSGYAGGTVSRPSYEQVSSSTTGHAESVRVTYDPSVISYGTLLQVFFSIAHDPTELNRQGPDVGPQYRSAIFYENDEQKALAESYIAQLAKAHAFPRPIVTQVAQLKGFYPAESYHQDYATRHPDDLYIRINDAPKVAQLKERMPKLWRDEISAR
jgi:peptide-methionine (S)-S-oxide reductase